MKRIWWLFAATCLLPPTPDNGSREWLIVEIERLVKQSDIAEASNRIDEGVRRFPRDAVLHDLRGQLFAKQREPVKAHQAFCKAIELDVRFARAYRNRGQNYLALAETAEAPKFFAELVEQYRKHWDATNRL